MPQKLLKIQLLDITSLSSRKPRSLFSKSEIDKLAHVFLQVGGNVNLILVKRCGLEDFEVVEGHLEYYAAVRAREINDTFERINGVIVDKDNEYLLQEQHFSVNTESKPVFTDTENQIQTLIATLENNIVDHLRDQLKSEVSCLEDNLSKNIERKFDGIKVLVPRDEDHLGIFNSADFKVLIDKLSSAGFKGKRGQKIATAIIEERKKNRFTSFCEITDRVRLKNKNRAITGDSMIKILDAWNRFIDIEDTK